MLPWPAADWPGEGALAEVRREEAALWRGGSARKLGGGAELRPEPVAAGTTSLQLAPLGAQAEELLHTHYVAGGPTLFDWRLLIDGVSGNGATGPSSGTATRPGTGSGPARREVRRQRHTGDASQGAPGMKPWRTAQPRSPTPSTPRSAQMEPVLAAGTAPR